MLLMISVAVLVVTVLQLMLSVWDNVWNISESLSGEDEDVDDVDEDSSVDVSGVVDVSLSGVVSCLMFISTKCL